MLGLFTHFYILKYHTARKPRVAADAFAKSKGA